MNSFCPHLLANMGLVEMGTSAYRLPLLMAFDVLWLLRPANSGKWKIYVSLS